MVERFNTSPELCTQPTEHGVLAVYAVRTGLITSPTQQLAVVADVPVELRELQLTHVSATHSLTTSTPIATGSLHCRFLPTGSFVYYPSCASFFQRKFRTHDGGVLVLTETVHVTQAWTTLIRFDLLNCINRARLGCLLVFRGISCFACNSKQHGAGQEQRLLPRD